MKGAYLVQADYMLGRARSEVSSFVTKELKQFAELKHCTSEDIKLFAQWAGENLQGMDASLRSQVQAKRAEIRRVLVPLQKKLAAKEAQDQARSQRAESTPQTTGSSPQSKSSLSRWFSRLLGS